MVKNIKKVFAVICLSSVLLCGGCGSNQENNVVGSSEQNTTEQHTIDNSTEQTEEANPVEDNKKMESDNAVDYELSVMKNNSWEQDGMKCAQIDGVIKNHLSSCGKEWKVVITIPEGAKIRDKWNGNFNISGTQLTITPVDYNKEIAASSEISFGFIMEAKEDFEMNEARVVVDGKTYVMKDGEKMIAGNKESSNDSEDKMTTSTQDEKKIEKVDSESKNGKSAVKNHGQLSVKGTDIIDKNGKNFQLKGVSTHGLAWFPDYVNKEAFASLADYGVNAMRLAMYTDESGGYCNGGDKQKLEGLVFDGVEACKDLGMYVIIDWHVLREGDPNTYKDDAKAFFDMVSKKYASYDNVIYEICNEPCNGTTWDQIKSYAQEIIPVIRNNDENAIIIVGTPNWSQDVDIAADNPITGYDNIMYAVHFYAATHKEQIRNKVITARGKGLPVIVSECSICEASGNGTVDYDEAGAWMKYINENKMSMFAWNLSNKDEKSSLIKAGVIKKNGFEPEDFSETGTWFMEQYGK